MTDKTGCNVEELDCSLILGHQS